MIYPVLNLSVASDSIGDWILFHPVGGMSCAAAGTPFDMAWTVC